MSVLRLARPSLFADPTVFCVVLSVCDAWKRVRGGIVSVCLSVCVFGGGGGGGGDGKIGKGEG